MNEKRLTIHSKVLSRDLDYCVFGTGGKVCFVFPEQNGRYFDFKNFGLFDAVSKWTENGQVQLICVDSIDKDSWSDEKGNPRKRIELQEKWYHHIVDEMFPLYVKNVEKAMVTGCSMGGYHSAIFFFRRPDLFDTMLSLSGLYSPKLFFGDYIDDLVYDNSPYHFLSNMPSNHEYIELYNKSTIIACAGQHDSEKFLFGETKELDNILTQKNIKHWFDYWGYDVSHDWYWWGKQLFYFFGHIFEN